MSNSHVLWPNHVKCTVLFTIHVNGESLYNRNPMHPSPRRVSYGRYSPVRAVNQLLELADREKIPRSYLVSGQIVRRCPDILRRINACRHKIGFRGYDHEGHVYTDRPTQAWMDVIRRSQETFDRIIGKQVVGFVAISSDFQMGTPQIRREQLGFQYSSSMRRDDRPYRMCSQGKKSDFIEIPVRWELDDYPAFVYSFQPPQPKGRDRISNYHGVLSSWKHGFEGYYAEGGCMMFMLHSRIIGVPNRAQMLEELLDVMLAKGDVWFATGIEIAN